MHCILIDTEYADRVTFDLVVNFERMIGRRIPPADLPQWLDCLALDGGLKPGDNALEVSFIHAKDAECMKYFLPGNFKEDLTEKAFKDTLGEFALQSYPIEDIVSAADMMKHSLSALLEQKDVESIMVVADMETYGDTLTKVCAEYHRDTDKAERKDITLFGMQPTNGKGFDFQILGYSLMAALGISAEELK